MNLLRFMMILILGSQPIWTSLCFQLLDLHSSIKLFSFNVFKYNTFMFLFVIKNNYNKNVWWFFVQVGICNPSAYNSKFGQLIHEISDIYVLRIDINTK